MTPLARLRLDVRGLTGKYGIGNHRQVGRGAVGPGSDADDVEEHAADVRRIGYDVCDRWVDTVDAAYLQVDGLALRQRTNRCGSTARSVAGVEHARWRRGNQPRPTGCSDVARVAGGEPAEHVDDHMGGATLAEQADLELSVRARPDDGHVGHRLIGPEVDQRCANRRLGTFAVRLEVAVCTRLGDRDVDNYSQHVGGCRRNAAETQQADVKGCRSGCSKRLGAVGDDIVDRKARPGIEDSRRGQRVEFATAAQRAGGACDCCLCRDSGGDNGTRTDEGKGGSRQPRDVTP